MYKSRVLFLFFILLFISCKESIERKTIKVNIDQDKSIVKTKNEQVEILRIDPIIIDTINCGLNFKVLNPYPFEKNQALRLANKYFNLDSSFKENHLDSIGEIFTKQLLNRIIPHWYGTPWDFEGHTSIPNKGEIACGYFVSTTLRDMGLNLNRYKLAQKAPIYEAKSIAIDLINFKEFDHDSIFKFINEIKSGLYFVGLDNHVGYLWINNGIAYFIHSNYITGVVMTELATESDAFYSSVYYISEISKNRELMEKWLTRDTMLIISKEVD